MEAAAGAAPPMGGGGEVTHVPWELTDAAEALRPDGAGDGGVPRALAF